jgi:hypothetical protein
MKWHYRSGGVFFAMILCILLIVGMYAFSLYRSMSAKAVFVNAHSHAALLDFAAMQMEAVIFNELGKQLKNPESQIFADLLLKTTPETETLALTNSLWKNKFTFLSQKEYQKMGWDATVKFIDFKGLIGTGKWTDPLEKMCRISVELNLSIGHLAARKLRKKYLFSRPCKIQRMALPVVSKFTLFVKEPEKTQAEIPGYNCFENMHDGNPTQNSYSSPEKSLPIVCCNAAKAGQTDLAKAGFVFLGGNDSIELHMTAGTHPDYGESFQFFPIGKTNSSVVVFDLNTAPDTPGFAAAGITLDSASDLKGALGIRAVVFGFYSVNTSGETMNYEDTLSRWFVPENAVTMNSSFLHLNGSLTSPTPTIVFGKVKRTYARYSKLVVTLSSRTDKQGICWLKNPVTMQTTSGQTVDHWDLVPFPGSFTDKKTSQSYSLSNDVLAMSNLFLSWDAYLSCASGLFSEEYNRVNDYLMRAESDKGFPPQEGDFKTKYGSYEITGEALKLVRNDSEIVLFENNLNELTTEDLIKDRTTIEVADQKEFDTFFKTDTTTYDLQGQIIRVKKGPLTFPAGTVIATSGIVSVEGEIVLSGGLQYKDEKSLLTLISKGKNITLSGENVQVQANLIALDGTVKSTSMSRVNLKGGVAVKTLSPKDWKAGGLISYDDRFDPLQMPTEGTYVVQIADYHDRWNIEQVLDE